MRGGQRQKQLQYNVEIDVSIKHFEGICEGLMNSTGEIKEMEARNKPLNDKEGLLGGQGKEIY